MGIIAVVIAIFAIWLIIKLNRQKQNVNINVNDVETKKNIMRESDEYQNRNLPLEQKTTLIIKLKDTLPSKSDISEAEANCQDVALAYVKKLEGMQSAFSGLTGMETYAVYIKTGELLPEMMEIIPYLSGFTYYFAEHYSALETYNANLYADAKYKSLNIDLENEGKTNALEEIIKDMVDYLALKYSTENLEKYLNKK